MRRPRPPTVASHAAQLRRRRGDRRAVGCPPAPAVDPATRRARRVPGRRPVLLRPARAGAPPSPASPRAPGPGRAPAALPAAGLSAAAVAARRRRLVLVALAGFTLLSV